MNKKLSLVQTLIVLGALLALAGFGLWKYFAAPAFPAEDPRNRLLNNTAITNIIVNLGELAPAHVAAVEPPRPSGAGGGGGGGPVTPKGEAARKEAARYAKNVAPKNAKVAETLRQAGVPVAYDDLEKKAAAGKVPLVLYITLEGNGTLVDGQPTYGVLGYKVQLKRDIYTAPDASSPVMINVAEDMTGAVGVTSPETLAAKQEEALDKALRAIITRWKEDNPDPAK